MLIHLCMYVSICLSIWWENSLSKKGFFFFSRVKLWGSQGKFRGPTMSSLPWVHSVFSFRHLLPVAHMFRIISWLPNSSYNSSHHILSLGRKKENMGSQKAFFLSKLFTEAYHTSIKSVQIKYTTSISFPKWYYSCNQPSDQ